MSGEAKKVGAAMKEESWVLVVEPDQKAVEDWRACLWAEGINVEVASSVKEAATKLKTSLAN